MIRGHGGCGDLAYPYLIDVLIKNSIKGSRILDIGSNAGIHAIRLCQAGAKEVVCVEPVELYHKQFEFVLDYIQKKNNEVYNIVLIKDYAESLHNDGVRLALGKFDIVIASAILYHIGKLTVRGRAKKEVERKRREVVEFICELSNGDIIVRERTEDNVKLDDEEFAKYGFYCAKRMKKSRIISCYIKS
jgi:SAM-dependent methyltransferase